MSSEAVRQFLQRAAEEPTLKEELAIAAISGDSQAEVIALGAKYGFTFTPSELSEEIRRRQVEAHKKRVEQFLEGWGQWWESTG